MDTRGYTLQGKVEAVLVTPFGSNTSTEQEKISLFIRHGIRGDRHAGGRLADVREKSLRTFGLPADMEIANHREVSIVSVEEMQQITRDLDLPKKIPNGTLGENIILNGIPKLSDLPSGTLIFFEKRTAVIAVWGQNTPCLVPGKQIEELFPGSTAAPLFVKAALGKRGLVGSVYASGKIKKGDTAIAMVPSQKIYNPNS